MKRLYCILLALALLLSCAPFALAETEAPIVFTVARAENAAVPFIADAPSFRAIEELSGVRLQMTELSSADYNTKMMARYASGDMPDIFIGFGMTAREMIEDGTILDLTDLIAEYAPNLTALYEANPNLNRNNVDGRIYTLHRIRFDQNLEAGSSPFIRMDLLKESGLPVPATWDELYDTLYQLCDTYDMIGWGARGIGRVLGTWSYLWMDSFGADYGTYMDDAGAWHVGRVEPEYKDAITFLNKCVANGVLDSEFVNMSATEWQEGLASGKYLFWYDNATFASGINSALAANIPGAYFEPLPLLESPYGTTQSYKQPNHYTNVYFVSADVENKEALGKFINWCYSEEAAVVFAYGREGETFYYDEAGQPHYTQEVLDHYLGMEDSYYQACSELGVNDCYFTTAWLNLPTEAFRATSGNVIDARYIYEFYKEDLLDGTIVERDVEPPKNPQQTARIQEIAQAVKSLSETEFTKFVMGARSMDEYDAFIEELRALGVDEWAEILNEAEEEYQATLK